MATLLSCVYLLFVAWPLLLANPIRRTSENRDTQPDRGTTYSSVHELQNVHTPEYPCTTDFSCYPKEYVNDTIPYEFVMCRNGTCVCQDCFYRLNDTCEKRKCHHFENDTRSCVDDRKSQKDILILSIFLSSTGAANSYIGQDTLGLIQSGILLLTLILCMCICCVKKCCLDCCSSFEDECECCDCCEDFWGCFCKEFCARICVYISCVGIMLCFLVIISWWVADIVAFSENVRLDGDGCPLKIDL
jgi:hypothetical protein